MIHFQGQRLALSDSIASCIEVLSVNELAEQELKPLSQLNLKQSCLVAKIGGKKRIKAASDGYGLDAKYFSYPSKYSTIRRPTRNLVTRL